MATATELFTLHFKHMPHRMSPTLKTGIRKTEGKEKGGGGGGHTDNKQC